MWEMIRQHSATPPNTLLEMLQRGELAYEAVTAILQARGLNPAEFGLRGTERGPFVPRNDIASYRVTGDIGEYGGPTPITRIGNSEEAGRIARQSGWSIDGVDAPAPFANPGAYLPLPPGPARFNPDAQLDPSQVEDRRGDGPWDQLYRNLGKKPPEPIEEKIKRAKRLTPPGSFVK
jgi:hypothetical protein